MMLVINETIRDPLGLVKIDERSMELADGSSSFLRGQLTTDHS
jgi:hypothetical protein